MKKIEAAFSDVKEVYNSELSKNLYKKKGTLILQTPERNNKTKYIYSGYCIKHKDKIIKMLPSLEDFGEDKKLVKNMLKRPLNKRNLGEYSYYKVSEL